VIRYAGKMGKKQSKMDPHQLIHLLNRTQFEEKELEKWYQKFIKEYPDGFISKPQFENMYQSFFPKGDAREFADHIFRTFDGNSDGKIGKLSWKLPHLGIIKDVYHVETPKILQLTTKLISMHFK
jgi:hypothetical protein